MAMHSRSPLALLKRWKGKDIRFELLVRMAHWLYPGYRLTWPNLDWWDDQWFNSYLERFGERQGMNTHRRWEMYQLMRLAAAVPGDTAECGAYVGAGSFLICEMNRRNTALSRWHHVFDSFTGLSKPDAQDGRYWREGDLRSEEACLTRNLSGFERYRIHAGWIPARFAEVENHRFAFVHIDVDLYQPTNDSLEFFYPRLNEGAILLCDDYGFPTCPGATKAIDDFMIDKPEQFISLAAGGGFLLKGHTPDCDKRSAPA